jgi:NADH-quinone oxidoreductase subunit N
MNNFFINDIYTCAGEFILLLAIVLMTLLSTPRSNQFNLFSKYNILVKYSSDLSIFWLAIVQLSFVYKYYLLNNFNILLNEYAFNNSIVVNSNILQLKIFLVLLAMLIIQVSKTYFNITKMGYFEYNVLLLSGLLGSLITLSANDLLILYISLEVQALSFYIMATLKKSVQSTEAGLKYFIIGSFSSAVLLFGISLIILFTGQHNLNKIKEIILFINYNFNSNLFFFKFFKIFLIISILLIIIALLIKLAVAPFHEWIADIYEGIMTPTALLFATIPKISIFFVLTRLIENIFFDLFNIIQPVIGICCVLSLILGSFNAYQQKNIKRFLAFSSVNHFGFILIGLVLGTELSIKASFLYLTFYIFLTFSFWAHLNLISYVKINGSNTQVHHLTKIVEIGNLITYNPALTFSIILLLLSMGGIPPLAGFTAKASIFFVLLDQCQIFVTSFNNINSFFFNLILIAGFFSSIISVLYYIRIIKILFSVNSKYNIPFIFNLNKNFMNIFILSIICFFNMFIFLFFI